VRSKFAYFPYVALLFAIVLSFATPRLCAAAAADRPNVVFILTDDQRWDALGCEDKPLLGIDTPHLDRLAEEGAIFKNSFVTTSLCSPSRASMLSGLYAHSHGVSNNFTDYPEDLASYPRQLKKAGYETAYIGKWHMGEDSDERRLGFDYWITHKGQGKYYDTKFNVNGERKVKKGYYTTVVTDMACDWLKQKHDRPFLLILGHKAPHGPFVPEKKYRDTYDHLDITYPATAFKLQSKPDWVKERLVTWHGIYGPLYGFREEYPDTSSEGVDIFGEFVRSYTGTINSVDDSMGRVYETLKETGQLDNTLIIFTGDNSFLLGEHGMIDKRTMHEESIRVPLLVRYPRLVKPGTVVDQMVLNIDHAPSICDICGVESLPKIHGRSYKELLAGDGSNWRQSWYYEYNYEKQFPYTPNVRGVRTDRFKYVHYPHGDGKPDRHKAELYDLAKDPKHADKIAELKQELERLQRAADGLPDEMPIDQGIKTELPEESIR